MVVRMRANKAHRNNRRSHFALESPRLSACSSCGALKRSHEMCPKCGKYNGRTVVDFEAQIAKKEKKRKEKEAAARS